MTNTLNGLKAQDAVNQLIDHFLGAGWYSTAVTAEQVNAHAVEEIKSHYDGIEAERKARERAEKRKAKAAEIGKAVLIAVIVNLPFWLHFAGWL